MIETLRTILDPNFLLHNSVLAGAVIGVVCPLVGMFFVLRRAVFLGVALPQVSSAGIASAFWLHSLGIHFLGHAETERGTAILGSTAFTVLAIVVLAMLERRGRGLVEGRTGAAYALAASMAILFTAGNPSGEMHVSSLLKGEIVAVADTDLQMLLISYGITVMTLLICRRPLVLVSYDRDVAQTLFKRPWTWDLLLYGLFGITISIGVMIVGPLTLFGFLILPVLSVLPWSRGLASLAIGSSILGGIIAIAGFAIAYRQDLPVGPTDVTLGFSVFATSSGLRMLLRR